MNITIFGGTGPAVLLTIEKALSSGHRVTAYAREPDKITIRHSNLETVKGELTEYDKIAQSLKSADAVISLLGPKKISKLPEISNGYKNIIDVMEKNGPKRLIAAVSSSYRDSQDRFQFGVEFGVIMLKLLGSSILKDILAAGEKISKSNLNWTIIRLPVLTNKPPHRKLNVGYTGDGKINFFSLSRVELADFLIKQLDDETYVHKAPVISN